MEVDSNGNIGLNPREVILPSKGELHPRTTGAAFVLRRLEARLPPGLKNLITTGSRRALECQEPKASPGSSRGDPVDAL